MGGDRGPFAVICGALGDPKGVHLEAVGEVVEATVTSVHRPGSRVMVRVRNGTYVNELVVPDAALTPTPPGFSDTEGAAFQVGFATAYHALVERARLISGEVLHVPHVLPLAHWAEGLRLLSEHQALGRVVLVTD